MKMVNKKNIYLLSLFVICLLMLAVIPTYAKFPSSYTSTNEVVGLSLDFSIAISNIEEYQQVTVPVGESLTFNVAVTNDSGAVVYYGIWYRMVNPTSITSDIEIGRLSGTTVETSGSIDDDDSTTATIIIKNNSSSEITVDIGVASSDTSTSDIEYLGGKYLITGDVDDTLILLNTVSVGSYVAYAGNNGCDSTTTVNGYTACSGMNANYVSDTDMGYCNSSSYKFTVNGWRVAYIANESAYLVSAGAPECVENTTSYTYEEMNYEDTDGDIEGSTGVYWGSNFEFNSTTGVFSLIDADGPVNFADEYEGFDGYTCLATSADATCTTLYHYLKYIEDSVGGVSFVFYAYQSVASYPSLSNITLKYCNTSYANGGVCDSTTAWAINDDDYEIITGNGGFGTLSCELVSDCGEGECDITYYDCGKDTDLISNGGTYWFDKDWGTSFYYWDPALFKVVNDSTVVSRGVRPVLVLDSSVAVVSGSGTYADPYVITNQ